MASRRGWLSAVGAATPILLVAVALAALWVEAPARANDPSELKGIAPPATAPAPARPTKTREVTYEPWELVRT